MESLSRPHWEALTPATRQTFHQVSLLPFVSDFYLAGGTGLALHLGHRFSVDLDLFSPDTAAVGPDQRDALRNLLDDPSLAITYDKDGTFVATWHKVGVSFFRLPLYDSVLQDGVILYNHCMIEETLREKRQQILALAEKYGARNVRIFGSVARGDARLDSDIDFLVELEPGRSLFDLGGFLYDLQSLLGVEVDVVTEKGLRARIRERVLREAIPL